MKKRSFTFTICLLLVTHILFAQYSPVIKEYIAKYQDIAIQEMIRTGVPASITLAQGIHETEAGRSKLVLKSNNHFGIKCKSEWKGESVSHDDDARGECFRKYTDPFDSYRDHSDFLKNRAHYASLFKLDPADYEAWAKGLKKAGYATNPKYPQLLIRLIRDYNLQEYTLIALGKKGQSEQEATWASANTITCTETNEAFSATEINVEQKKYNYPQGVFKINETNVIYATKGTAYLAIAEQQSIPLSRLFEFNDMPVQDIATKDHLVYLERKRKSGVSELHTVAVNENLWDIAQEEGIRLESLLQLNFLKEGMQPQVGEILYLQGQSPAMPKVHTLQNSYGISIKIEEPKSLQASYADYTVHTVGTKETMYSISKRYAVSVEELKQWNNLQTDELKTGQQLRINKK